MPGTYVVDLERFGAPKFDILVQQQCLQMLANSTFKDIDTCARHRELVPRGKMAHCRMKEVRYFAAWYEQQVFYD